MSEPLTCDVPGVGKCELSGEGPWRVDECGGSSFDIRDSAGRVTNPTVWQKFSTTAIKPNASVVFAKRADAQAVVDTFNAALIAK